jgi:predicted GNAT superfamily acetyltransferase
MTMDHPTLEALTSVDTGPDMLRGATMLALNNAHAGELSWLTAAGLSRLVD